MKAPICGRLGIIDEFYLDITGMNDFMVVTNGRMNLHSITKKLDCP
jgi:hypothetical protein